MLYKLSVWPDLGPNIIDTLQAYREHNHCPIKTNSFHFALLDLNHLSLINKNKLIKNKQFISIFI